jgi:hypothetical protein
MGDHDIVTVGHTNAPLIQCILAFTFSFVTSIQSIDDASFSLSQITPQISNTMAPPVERYNSTIDITS